MVSGMKHIENLIDSKIIFVKRDEEDRILFLVIKKLDGKSEY